MGKSDDVSKARPGRNTATSAEETAPRALPTESFLKNSLDLMVAIEVERARLMKVESLLHCTLLAMDYDDGFDDGERPYYPNVIEVARDMLNETLAQLDSVRLAPLIEKLEKRPDDATAAVTPGVREPRVEYIVN